MICKKVTSRKGAKKMEEGRKLTRFGQIRRKKKKGGGKEYLHTCVLV